MSGLPERSPRGRALPGVSSRLASALALLLGLLVVVALASRDDAPGTGGGKPREAPLYLLDLLTSFFLLVVMPLGLVLLLYAYWVRGRDGPRRKPASVRQAIVIVVSVAAASLAAVAVARALQERRQGGEGRDPPAASLLRPPGAGVERRPLYEPRLEWAPVIAFAALLTGAGVIVALRSSRRSAEDDPDARLAAAIAALAADTLDDLRAELDPRRAVIGAYARMEAALDAHGLPRDPSEAPLEYLARILSALDVHERAVSDLTDLFARAKFSREDVDGSMKEQAISALVAVRDDLRGESE